MRLESLDRERGSSHPEKEWGHDASHTLGTSGASLQPMVRPVTVCLGPGEERDGVPQCAEGPAVGTQPSWGR